MYVKQDISAIVCLILHKEQETFMSSNQQYKTINP
jgi:hypothetical protein